MKYKVGDKVKVKSWEDLERVKCGFGIGMEKYCGKIVSITENCGYYRIKEDKGVWVWNDDMFEPIEQQFTKDNLKTGMIVQVKNGEYYRVLLKKYIKNKEIDILENCYNYNFLCLENYDINLKNKINNLHDIHKVLMAKYPHSNIDVDEYEIIWERPKTKKMTLADIEKELGYKIEIVEE